MKLFKLFHILLITISTIVLSCCQSYESPVVKVLKGRNDSTMFQKEWVQMKSRCNKLVFKKYYLKDSTVAYDRNSVVWTDSTIDQKKIERFRLLFVNAKDGGYCCCPSTHYKVSFYKDISMIGEYSVDTSETKNKAMFYNGNLQTSFEIDLSLWNSFLKDK